MSSVQSTIVHSMSIAVNDCDRPYGYIKAGTRSDFIQVTFEKAPMEGNHYAYKKLTELTEPCVEEKIVGSIPYLPGMSIAVKSEDKYVVLYELTPENKVEDFVVISYEE